MGDEFPNIFMVDGIDRLGKSSLIKGIQDALGYHLVIHYDKPKVLDNYLITAQNIKESDPLHMDEFYAKLQHLSTENLARFLYQDETNRGMFNLMRTEIPIIFDRTHLGELVYAPLYRNYSGDYVYDMEEEFIKDHPYTFANRVRMILLTSSNTEMLKDDGLSFDSSKKEEEQKMFIKAFKKSNLANKVMIDVHDGKGGYRPYADILAEALYKPYK